MSNNEIFNSIIKLLPSQSSFTLEKVEDIIFPHPYTITPKHVEIASDKFGGILGKNVLQYCDDHDIMCGYKKCHLRSTEHKAQKTLFIAVDDHKDLNDIPNLGKWLSQNKEYFISLGIQGFAFPNKK